MRGVMKAMVLTGHGGLDKYAWHEDWPMPELGPMEVLIKVGACGLNNTDVNTRTGWYSKTVRRRPRPVLSTKRWMTATPHGAGGPSAFRASKVRMRWARWSRSARAPIRG